MLTCYCFFFLLGEYCLQVVLWNCFLPHNEETGRRWWGGRAYSELDDRLVSMIQDFCKL